MSQNVLCPCFRTHIWLKLFDNLSCVELERWASWLCASGAVRCMSQLSLSFLSLDESRKRAGQWKHLSVFFHSCRHQKSSPTGEASFRDNPDQQLPLGTTTVQRFEVLTAGLCKIQKGRTGSLFIYECEFELNCSHCSGSWFGMTGRRMS